MAAANVLLPKLKRDGLRAGVLGCEGETREYAGDNAQAMSSYQQAVALAEAVQEQTLLAGALFQRGYLRGLQGESANGLVDLRRAQKLCAKLDLPHQVAGTLNGVSIIHTRMV